MACGDLIKFPSGILKILHFVFNLLAILCLVIRYYFELWLVKMSILLVASIIVLIIFICIDGSSWKTLLLVYYTIGSSLAFASAIEGITFVTRASSHFEGYWTVCFALIFTLGSLAFYVCSALVNGLKGDP